MICYKKEGACLTTAALSCENVFGRLEPSLQIESWLSPFDLVLPVEEGLSHLLVSTFDLVRSLPLEP